MIKKLLFLFIAVALSATGFSQAPEKLFLLAEIYSSDNLEHEIYTYNDDMLLETTNILMDNGVKVKDSLSYDTSNNVTRIDGYQLMNGVWEHVSYIDYTYDADGNRLSRTNYNHFNGNFHLGGIYNYEYEDNKLTQWELLMGGTDLAEVGNVTYDSDGRILEELAQDTWSSTSLQDSWKIDYVYNPDGTLNNSTQSFWEGSSWNSYGGEWFYYDDNKNCIKWEQKSGNTVTNKNEYDYDLDYLVEELVLPINPEVQSEKKNLVEMRNKVEVNRWYTENDQGDLTYICDYIYEYENIGTMGVQNPDSVLADIMIYPNPTSDLVTINSGKNTISNIDVMDASGKTVLKESVLNRNKTSVNTSNLEAGIYYLRLLTSKGMVTQKLVVQ